MTLNSRMRPLLGLAIFFVAVFLFGRYVAEQDDTRNPFYVRFEIFGTFGEMILYHDREQAETAAEEVLGTLQELHNRFNVFNPESELSRLNARAYQQPVPCSEPLWEVLQHARRGHRLTGGAFDVTVGPLMHLWGFHGRRGEWPTEAEIAQVRQAVGLGTLLFEAGGRTVRFTHPQTRIDLGGIAKGYALDCAAEILDRHKIRKGLINLGGNIRALAPPQGGRSAYRIGVRNPAAPDAVLGRIALANACVATSGGYENYRRFEDKTVSHVIDPRTAAPVTERVGVSVVTPRGVDSDMFSTAVLVGGAPVAHKLASTIPETRMLVTKVGEDGEHHHVKVGWQWAPDASETWLQKLWRSVKNL